jgi:peptidoglycan/LPS O-acetylase OafA/YrhL
VNAPIAPAEAQARASSSRLLDIPSLDGIRAVSFAIVFAGHAGLGDIVPGGFGVTVFFFLSGFLITTLLRIEFQEHGTVSLRRFYLRRALRILPPFYVALALAVGLALLAILPGGFRSDAVLAQIFYWANYWTIAHSTAGQPLGTGVYWSLAVEEHFYLLFPLLFLLLLRSRLGARRQALALWSICALVLVWRGVLAYALGQAGDRTYMASDTRIDSILFGCALAVYGSPVLDSCGPLPPRVWKYLLLPAALALLLMSFAYRDPQFRESLRYTLQGVALYPIFIVAVRWSGWGPFRLLNLPLVRFVGVLSYSLYLVHQVMLYAVSANIEVPAVLTATIALALSLVIAVAIHVLLERPAARLRRRLECRSTGRTTSGTAAGVPSGPVAPAGFRPPIA